MEKEDIPILRSNFIKTIKYIVDNNPDNIPFHILHKPPKKQKNVLKHNFDSRSFKRLKESQGDEELQSYVEGFKIKVSRTVKKR
jgi:hypothetical protein